MSRTLASALAIFAASLLVFSSALMLTFGPASKPSGTPAPAVLNQVEPQSGANPAGAIRQGRIGSDMNATIRSMEGRAEIEAGLKQPAKDSAVVDAPVLQPVQPQSDAKTMARRPGWQPEPSPPGQAQTVPGTVNQAGVSRSPGNPSPVNLPTLDQADDSANQASPAPISKGPPQKLLSRLNPGGQEPVPGFAGLPTLYDAPGTTTSPNSINSSGPINLLPRRGAPAVTNSENTAQMPANVPAPPMPVQRGAGFQPGANFQPGALAAQPSYTPAPAPMPGAGPTYIPQGSADEANMTADQLNERELQRIKRWRETTPGAQ
jgi:hypothetical protein